MPLKAKKNKWTQCRKYRFDYLDFYQYLSLSIDGFSIFHYVSFPPNFKR